MSAFSIMIELLKGKNSLLVTLGSSRATGPLRHSFSKHRGLKALRYRGKLIVLVLQELAEKLTSSNNYCNKSYEIT